MIESGRFTDYVRSLLEGERDKKLWELYLACVANPYSQVTSFDEFKQQHTRPAEISDIDLEATVQDSFNVLQNFHPEE